MRTPCPVVAVVGWKNSGKTHLVSRLVSHFATEGLRVSTIKHAHHGFDLDRPGKDSHAHRDAGALEVLIASASRYAILHELRGEDEPGLETLLSRLAPVDLVIVEGFKAYPVPKVEVHRPSSGAPLLAQEDPGIIAVAAHGALPDCPVPVVAVDDTAALAAHIARALDLIRT